ncbi:MAG: hypothetical protein K2Q25_11905 [Mycobacteriaceae bacterium]|nr:hypothetical protein [Mycobacteriaceae bacterium]
MIRRQGDIIDVTGVNGDWCRISPPGFSWGPQLAPGSTGLYDMPIQTNWGSYGFGQFFQSWKPKRRDVVWTVDIVNPETGTLLDQDADLWHVNYSRWKAMFSPAAEATVTYTSVDGDRTLGLRTLQSPKPFSANHFEGVDPHIFGFGSVVQTMAAELPVYVGTPETFVWEVNHPGTFWFTLPFYNPASVDIWPEWHLTGGAVYQLPDYSFGNEAYGRGKADKGKTVRLAGLLNDEDLDIQTRPDLETFVTSLETQFAGRMAGRDFEYPIPPGQGSSGKGCVVQANVTHSGGARVELVLPRWYDEPFSTPRLV